MPLRQTIGISLAVIMASTGAIAKLPDKSDQHQAGQTPAAKPCAAQRSSAPHRAARPHAVAHHARHSWHHRVSYRAASTEPAPGDDNTTSLRPNGPMQIGAAAWYGLVGRSTANGEVLDTVTPTAAHRSLPLSSYAKVTSLDNGRSVVVKINDRGPYNRRFVIDLSPRAADLLGMRHAGVAAVAVEPVAGPAGNPTVTATSAVYRTASVAVQ